MAIKRLNESPSIADQIIIDIECPNADGCFVDDPYKVDKVVITYVERTFSGDNYSKHDNVLYDANIQKELTAAVKDYCASQTDENAAIVEKLQAKLIGSANLQSTTFSDAMPVLVLGDEDEPAWIGTDEDNAKIVHVEEDDDGNTVYGRYEVQWSPLGMREGDYFISWTWSPEPTGSKLSNYIYFRLEGSTQLTTSIPTHFTNPKKYVTLLERYLPETCKSKLTSTDLTPEVLTEWHAAVAKLFTGIEDTSNQILDLIDANATHESLLTFLAGTLGLKLRTNDPTLWRRQIKTAVPLYKRKGTLPGLRDALSQAGVELKKFTPLWQVQSGYTYQELFNVTDVTEFTLSNEAILPIDPDFAEVYYRAADSDDWITLSTDYVDFVDSQTFQWIGDQLSVDPVELQDGDSIRIVYQLAEFPDNDAEDADIYIRQLPLMDQRDERDQEYPLKNWNTRLIEEDDPLFDTIIPTRNPYHDPLVYGKIRTEFPYSENVYNMEEYNGSIRDSMDPCDIDKDFLDSCSGCLSSKYTLDLEVENLCDDRIQEIQEIVRDYTPFHAVLHSLNMNGTVHEFIQSPVEDIQSLMTYQGTENTLAGNAQMIFNRSMGEGNEFDRTELADATTVATDTGTMFNQKMIIYSPDVNFENLPLDDDKDYTLLEILSPSANVGDYEVENADRNFLTLTGASEPLDQSVFTFRLSNERGTQSTTDLFQDDYFVFYDTDVDFSISGLKTQWDIDNSDYAGGAWKIYIAAYSQSFEILDILPNGRLILSDPTQDLPTSNTTGITYILRDDSNVNISNGTTGRLVVSRRGRVELGATIIYRGSSQTLTDVRDLFDPIHNNGDNHFVKYLTSQYPFAGFVPATTNAFYIWNYTGGDVGGATIKIYQRLVDGDRGYLHYQGLRLECSTDYEVSLGIRNGANAEALYTATDAHGDDYILQLENNTFMQNFLILIDSEYYAITNIDGDTIELIGPHHDWETGSGTSVNFEIIKFEKQGGIVDERTYPPMPGHEFDFIDRRGNEIIEYSVEDAVPLMMLMNSPETETSDFVSYEENITFNIEYRE